MRNKPADVIYCGVRKNKIISAKLVLDKDNLKHFYNWMEERYKIHLQKDVEKSRPPWTDNPTLRKYKFTNVRREHDRESRWLIENICKSPELSYENKILNIILFRLFNKSETIKITGLFDWNNLDFSDIKNKILAHRQQNSEYAYFSNAFYTSGPKKAANLNSPDEKEMVVKIIKLVKHYKEKGITQKIIAARSQIDVFTALNSLEGIGDFLAYQIFVDLTYLDEFPFSENEFVVAGPGCKNGLNLVFRDFNGLTYEEALFWLRNNQQEVFSKLGYNPTKLFSDLPIEERYLNIMSLENCMCEISKYIRALKGVGRPRIRYVPR